MKVKLLEPIDGYEDVAEYRVPLYGETFISVDGLIKKATSMLAPWIVLTPKPLPVVEPPKWLGVVGDGDGTLWFVHWICEENTVYRLRCVDGGQHAVFGVHNCKLIRTANIPTAPELEALFKEPHGCATTNI